MTIQFRASVYQAQSSRDHILLSPVSVLFNHIPLLYYTLALAGTQSMKFVFSSHFLEQDSHRLQTL